MPDRRPVRWMIVPAAAGAAAAAVVLARRAERAQSAALVAALTHASLDAGRVEQRVVPGDLPAPVQRFFAHVLRPGRSPIRLAEFRQAGRLRTDVASNRWMGFAATHVVAPPACGFVWNARVRLAGVLHLDVRDALVEGEGSGRVTFMSAVPLARARGDPRLTAGALHRYLAEAAWYPTALMPSSALHWSPIDAGRALATLAAHGTTVSLEFRFDADGAVASIYTPARWGRFAGGYAQRAWEGRFGPTVERDGMRVPSDGEVGWFVDDAWRPVWQGRMVAARYAFAD